jgi:peptidoglycan/xylan/chitin deacetylase (PgdA/CDA1 family)
LYALRFADKKATSGLLVLTYHRISEQPDPTDPLKISVSMFENQIRFLKTNYFLISADDLRDAITGIRKLPDKACLITFDDGWQDNYTLGLPVLKKYHVSALIFLSTDYIGTGKILWHVRLRNILNREALSNFIVWDTLSENFKEIVKKIYAVSHLSVNHRSQLVNELIEILKSFPLKQIEDFILYLIGHYTREAQEVNGTMLSWEQVTEMSKNDISFGSHGRSHEILTHLNKNDLREELIESKTILENKLGQPVHFIAYPNGDYDEYTLCVAKEVGFLTGFTCRPGLNRCLENPLELKRINMREDSASGLSGEFSPLFYKIELLGIRFILKRIISTLSDSSD